MDVFQTPTRPRTPQEENTYVEPLSSWPILESGAATNARPIAPGGHFGIWLSLCRRTSEEGSYADGVYADVR